MKTRLHCPLTPSNGLLFHWDKIQATDVSGLPSPMEQGLAHLSDRAHTHFSLCLIGVLSVPQAHQAISGLKAFAQTGPSHGLECSCPELHKAFSLPLTLPLFPHHRGFFSSTQP